MTKATYSEELLQQITDNVWKERVLDLCNQDLNDERTEKLCKALANNTYIKALDVSYNQIGAAGAQALAANKTLISLDVSSNNQIDDAGAQALAANTTLTGLDVSSNQTGDAGAQALAANTALTTLTVTYNQIGDAGATMLAANTTFTSLDLTENQIGGAGAQALATNKTLTTLNLWGNQIGAAGAQALAANTTLTILNVSFNQLDAADAQVLAANKTLIALDVRGNEIGDVNEKAIRARLLKNQQRRENWLRLAPLIACVRSNCTSEIRNSFLPLIPAIAKWADDKFQEKKPGHVNLDKFFDTRFFKSHVQTQLSDAPANKLAVTQIVDEAKHQGHRAVVSATSATATAAQPPSIVKFGK